MLNALRSIGTTAVGAAGAGMVTGALLFAGAPIAQAAPPVPATTFDTVGPHGAPDVPLRPGGGGGGHGGGGNGGGGHGGGGWGGHGGNWNGHGGNWGGHPGWGNGGWGPPGQVFRPWWNWWW